MTLYLLKPLHYQCPTLRIRTSPDNVLRVMQENNTKDALAFNSFFLVQIFQGPFSKTIDAKKHLDLFQSQVHFHFHFPAFNNSLSFLSSVNTFVLTLTFKAANILSLFDFRSCQHFHFHCHFPSFAFCRRKQWWPGGTTCKTCETAFRFFTITIAC